MIRRSLGRGRLILIIGALVMLAGSIPAWWTLGGTPAFPIAQTGNAFDFPSISIVVFLAAVAALFVIVLPYATRDGEAGLDRPLTYGLLALAALIAFGIRLYQIYDFGGLGMPDRAPGLWITGAGLLIALWGIVELLGERPLEY